MRKSAGWTVGCALTLCALWLAGCSTAGYDKSEAAAGSMQAVATDVQAESHALESTVGALKELVQNPPADLKLQFRHYNKSLDRLEACAKRAENSGREMQQRHAAYFAAWDKVLAQVDYDVIREGGESRRAEVQVEFDAVDRRYQDTQSVVRPMIVYLRDLERTLSMDLTPGGVQSVSNIVAHAQENTQKVQRGLSALVVTLSESSAKMMPAMVTAQKASGTQTPAGRTASR